MNAIVLLIPFHTLLMDKLVRMSCNYTKKISIVRHSNTGYSCSAFEVQFAEQQITKNHPSWRLSPSIISKGVIYSCMYIRCITVEFKTCFKYLNPVSFCNISIIITKYGYKEGKYFLIITNFVIFIK